MDTRELRGLIADGFDSDLIGRKQASGVVKLASKTMFESGLPDEEVRNVALLFQSLSKLGRDQLQFSKSNTIALATTCCEIVANGGEAQLWRWVCMPETILDDDCACWEVTLDNPRYNTLEPALFADQEVVSMFEDIGIDCKLNFVLNDWELPFLRTTDKEKSVFASLDLGSQQRLIEDLSRVRGDVSSWINDTCIPLGSNGLIPDITFLSQLVGYSDFVDMMDNYSLELSPEYIKIINREIEFVRKTRVGISDFEALTRAKKRVCQYAIEAVIMGDTFSNASIFLNSEYPVGDVWKKMNLLIDVPTLFYRSDDDVKNI